jgi:hypothetical protein
MRAVVTDKVMVVSQNCMDLARVMPGSCSGTFITPHSGNEVINIKVEVTDRQEEEDSVRVTVPVIKDEHEVSCMAVYPLLSPFHKY